MSYKELKDAYKQAKSRERVRSTFFEDEVGKASRRQQRRLSEKKEIDEAIVTELEEAAEIDDLFERIYGYRVTDEDDVDLK